MNEFSIFFFISFSSFNTIFYCYVDWKMFCMSFLEASNIFVIFKEESCRRGGRNFVHFLLCLGLTLSISVANVLWQNRKDFPFPLFSFHDWNISSFIFCHRIYVSSFVNEITRKPTRGGRRKFRIFDIKLHNNMINISETQHDCVRDMRRGTWLHGNCFKIYSLQFSPSHRRIHDIEAV